ncbi:S9 family peptidase [Ginsengibacter hankyongi]|uniref:prolyl oligopeptidase n=1 Tax=Ginsengibacter hankyongi TaxID=2607284 RepID=A0A5J5IDJ4_9BACT|nr:prolyl oligopeptidase family serine peptidase [Ginsengibacter hankyongi]KAA9037216.1 S9 family peptidase [Ginsengibacter hankyongi]
MVKINLILLFISMLLSTQNFAQVKYPETKKVNQVDDYFGTKVTDPYRWLEDDNSEETKEWVEEENKVTGQYLSAIPFYAKVKNKLEQMWNYPKYSSPFKEGEWYYFYKNDGLQNQSILYRQKGLEGTPEIFIDPNKMSKDGTAAISTPAFSKNKRYAVYLEAQAGSDWQMAHIMNVADKQLLKDEVNYIKFSGTSWKGDDGFYYSRYPKPDETSKLTNQNQHHMVYYHKLGTSQNDDVLIYEDNAHPLRTIGAGLSEDEHFLILGKSEGTSGSEIWVKDMKSPSAEFKLLIKGFDTEADFIDNDGDYLLVRTNADAPNYKVVLIDPKKPAKENWKTIIPERKELLESVGTAGHKLFLTYLQDASSRVYQTNYKGNLEREIQLPGIGSAAGFNGYVDDKELFYTYSSFDYPATIFRYNIATGHTDLFRKSEVKINADNYQTVQTFFTSKDGTKVPMFITYKKGLQLNGNNPVVMYGYGGFNIPMTPAFSIFNAFFLEQGGVSVVVNLRGGNEYGEAWHKGGMLQNKQNVFDDFIAAAQFLIDKKYTNPAKLAMRGGSNGGLLVGAVMTQRPDLFKVAIPQVGVMDMLRYHKFTIGWAWATEYGRSDNSKAEFENLFKYSPLHNLKPGVKYPATLITSADHDDRVVPAHSFKFAATLQADNDGTNPTLIRIETRAGHGAGKPTGKQIEEAADIWSFVMYNLKMDFKD